MQKKTKLLVFALVLAVGVAVAVGVQTGAFSSLMDRLRGDSTEKAVDATRGVVAPATAAPAEQELGGFSEVDAHPQPGASSGQANIVEDLPEEDPPKGR